MMLKGQFLSPFFHFTPGFTFLPQLSKVPSQVPSGCEAPPVGSTGYSSIMEHLGPGTTSYKAMGPASF